MQEVAEKLRELYDASAYTSWNGLRDDLFIRLGKDFTPSAETIKQMHTPGGKASKVPDPVVLGTLCSLYQQPVEAVSPEVADLLRVLKSRLGKTIDLRTLTSTCSYPFGSNDLRLFDPDELPVVIDLRDRVVTHMHHKESFAPLANAS